MKKILDLSGKSLDIKYNEGVSVALGTTERHLVIVPYSEKQIVLLRSKISN